MARDRRANCHADGETRLIRLVARSWRARVVVAGHSMEPTLRDGDWVLVDPLAYRETPARPGELVVAAGRRWLIKRVLSANGDRLILAGDHAAHRNDPLEVAVSDVRGRPWFRYWPPRRFGRVR